jgi:hypothetical protein
MAIPLSDLAAAGQQPARPQAATTQGTLASLVPQPPQLSQSGNPIEAAYFDRLANDYDGLKSQYAQITNEKGENTTKGGRLLNTDEARELSPEYVADRTKSADVHEPSSALVKQMYAEKLGNSTPPGLDNTVVFTAGGTGAGKSTGLGVMENVNSGVRNAEIVYDTNMNTFDSADKKVKQALDAGRKVNIIYTYRHPIEALEQGALTRASRMESQRGTGRTVPLDEHFKTHVGALETMKQLQEKYGDDHRFAMTVIDNSRGKGNARLVSGLDKLPKLNHTEIRKGLNDALENAYRTGQISRAIYEGTRVNGR